MGERGSLLVTALHPNLHSSALSPTQPPISPAWERTSEASTQHTSLSGLQPKDLVASLVAQMVKHLPTMRETQVRSLSWEDPPGEGNGNPLQYSCLEKSHGRRILVGYSPRSRKESDTTERLHFHPKTYFQVISEAPDTVGMLGGGGVKDRERGW